MAENKGVLPSSNVNTLGNANNKWENVYANKFTGALAGNASTASSAAQLTTARSINGTNFNGTGNITTANWGTARNISIADATAANTGTGVSVNGSGNVTLKLPATIKASITGGCSGNAGTATKLATARTINIQDSSATNTGTGASFDGSGNATIKLPATIKASLTGNVTGNVSGSSSSCTGNAATATKATQDSAGQQINTTYIKGLSVSNATLTYTKGNGTTGTVTINNVATATNADKLDGYHYTDIINNAKTSISSGVMGLPNFAGTIAISCSGNANSNTYYTTPSNGWLVYDDTNNDQIIKGLIAGNTLYLPSITINLNLVPVKKGFVTISKITANRGDNIAMYFVPCS